MTTPSLDTMRLYVLTWAGWTHISKASTREVYQPASGLEGVRPGDERSKLSEDDLPDGPKDWCPDLAHSLDAIAKIEAKLRNADPARFCQYITKLVDSGDNEGCCSTAPQRLEAIHRTLFPEKWGKE